MFEDAIAFLRAQAERYSIEADRANRKAPTRPHAAVLRANSMHCGFAAGELRTHAETTANATTAPEGPA
jgi:hypothetical protein